MRRGPTSSGTWRCSMMDGGDVHQAPASAGGRCTRRSLQPATGGARAWYEEENETGSSGADSSAISALGTGCGTVRIGCATSANNWLTARIWQIGQVHRSEEHTSELQSPCN